MELTAEQLDRLDALGRALVDQQAAKIIVEPQSRAGGYWFGGGNMVRTAENVLSVVGRFRNAGDSRTGVAAGTRGLELAVFQSEDSGRTFHKTLSLSKEDLSTEAHRVLSIEGAALVVGAEGVELFVSTEKEGIGYPEGFESYLKPGTGVWTIDRLQSGTVSGLAEAEVCACLASRDPATVHIKDPFVFTDADGAVQLFFCSHPFCWSSSNTGRAQRRPDGSFDLAATDFFPRGPAWDVAITRGTCLLDVPRVGLFADEPLLLMFYDGGECVRNMDEHAAAVSRPRGYSCEELGGLAWLPASGLQSPRRISRYWPMFVSPYGTGCSRYVDILSTEEGMYATWQQSQTDGSQPLVMNFVPADEIQQILS